MTTEDYEYQKTVMRYVSFSLFLVLAMVDGAGYWRNWFTNNDFLVGLLCINGVGVVLLSLLLGNAKAYSNKLRNRCANCGRTV